MASASFGSHGGFDDYDHDGMNIMDAPPAKRQALEKPSEPEGSQNFSFRHPKTAFNLA
jgi:hypothetical protein